MCHLCPIITAAEVSGVLSQMHSTLKLVERLIDSGLREIDKLEDSYRKAGIDYHTTQRPRHVPLEHLKKAFEISRIEEYQALFAPVTSLSKKLVNLKSELVHTCHRGSLQERVHRFDREIYPTYQALMMKQHQMIISFNRLQSDAEHLRTTGIPSFDIDGNGLRMAWQDPHHADEPIVPTYGQEEWNIFRAWVWSLPETQRTVAAGYRSLDQVARELAWAEEEEQMAEAEVEEVD